MNFEPNAVNGHRFTQAVKGTESTDPSRRSASSVRRRVYLQPRWMFVSVLVGLGVGCVVAWVQWQNHARQRSDIRPADAALLELRPLAQAARRVMMQGATLAIGNSDRDRTTVEAAHPRSSTAALALYGLCSLVGLFGAVFAVQVMRSHGQSSTKYIEQAARMTELEHVAGRVAPGPQRPPPLRLAVREGSRITANLSHVFEGLKEDFLLLAENAGVRLTIEPVPNVQVACGEAAVTIVLQNLVRNAIKYIGDGPSRQIVARTAISGGTVYLAVQGSGPSIRFERGVRPAGWREPPIGLGLATVKRIVEAHGGQVGIRSRPGQSACFWVNIPLAT